MKSWRMNGMGGVFDVRLREVVYHDHVLCQMLSVCYNCLLG